MLQGESKTRGLFVAMRTHLDGGCRIALIFGRSARCAITFAAAAFYAMCANARRTNAKVISGEFLCLLYVWYEACCSRSKQSLCELVARRLRRVRQMRQLPLSIAEGQQEGQKESGITHVRL